MTQCIGLSKPTSSSKPSCGSLGGEGGGERWRKTEPHMSPIFLVGAGRPRLSHAAVPSPLQLGLSCWERNRERRRFCLIFIFLREWEK